LADDFFKSYPPSPDFSAHNRGLTYSGGTRPLNIPAAAAYYNDNYEHGDGLRTKTRARLVDYESVAE
jgi:hypothetical protein